MTLYLFSMISIWTFGGLLLKPLALSATGLDLSWYFYSGLFLMVIGYGSYRGIDLNIRVLGIVVAAEIAVIVTFNVVTLVRGPDGYVLETFSWGSFTTGSIAVAVLYAICTVAGFEATTIFREEAREPGKSIPRATYIIVFGTAVFYALSAWCLIIALGAGGSVASSAADPSQAFTTAFADIFGTASGDFILALATSVMASGLSITNVAARYAYSLGVDQVLPRSLGRVHVRHGSPHHALGWTSAIAGAGIVIVAVTGLSPVETYSVISGVAILGFQLLLLLVSLSVIVFFRDTSRHDES